ncbi:MULTISPECIES: TIGR02285 family protein [Kordiimonas]|uniref:TIGR02285 family protein n=1 Tax=Kordiimonas TaxID=288021 RepID=UPI00257CBC5C|nr:TIGR02285 family protein [Kordiimonas sp. UBA4487]
MIKAYWFICLAVAGALQLAPTRAQDTPVPLPTDPSVLRPEGAAAKPTVMWYGGDYPPTFIARGEMKGQGYGDRILDDIIRHTPAYRHVFVRSTFNRGLSALKDRDNACIFGVLKTPEREAFIHYSEPLSSTLPNRVVVRRDRAAIMKPFLNEAGEVVLEKLLASPDLMVGLVTDRFYSPQINARLKTHKSRLPHVEMPEPRYGRLLARGRIDYTFGFPYEAAFKFRELGDPNGFITFPLAGEVRLMDSHIGCADKPLGRQIIADINRAASEAGAPETFRRYFEQWLDVAARADYRRALRERDARPGDQN